MIKIFLYWNTIRHLKIQQIYRRLWFHLIKPKLNQNSIPLLRTQTGIWLPPACRKKSLLNKNTFFFLNQRGNLDDNGWNNKENDKLWVYNQHYFDDLNAEHSKERFEWHIFLLKKWIKENKPCFGSGWEPYPTSLRIVNWIKWQYNGNALNRECLHSLAIQARWLFVRIEWHILGNHLFANAKSLVFAGLFFEGKEADGWFLMGLKIITKELTEQVLPDGGHFELSPMYHSIFLEDLMDLINLSQLYPERIPKDQKKAWKKNAERMLKFLLGICHPDGEIPLFNDAAKGIAPKPLELVKYAKRLNLNIPKPTPKIKKVSFQQYNDSGYICFKSDFAFSMLDVAKIGPNYLPAHGHADTLSFELSVFKKRFIVNGGTSTYQRGPIRQFERSTSAHNTIEIDNKNSSEVWSEFRVARRAYPLNLKIEDNKNEIKVYCSHNGYKQTHKRKWIFSENKLLIEDKILGEFNKGFARFYLHPDIKIIKKKQDTYLLEHGGKTLVIKNLVGNGQIKPGFYAPEFGKRVKTNCLVVDLVDSRCSMVEISWGVCH